VRHGVDLAEVDIGDVHTELTRQGVRWR